MKKVILSVVFLCTVCTYSQKNIHYNFSLNFTLTTNPNFGEYDDWEGETDWSLIIPNALLIRNGFDVELHKRVSVGINLGLDWHPDLHVLAIPYFVDTKFALIQVDDDKFFIGAGIGKLLKLGKAFERGKYYKVGAGYQISTGQKFSTIINLDFHRKKIANFENGRLNSFSFGVGMVFL